VHAEQESSFALNLTVGTCAYSVMHLLNPRAIVMNTSNACQVAAVHVSFGESLWEVEQLLAKEVAKRRLECTDGRLVNAGRRREFGTNNSTVLFSSLSVPAAVPGLPNVVVLAYIRNGNTSATNDPVTVHIVAEPAPEATDTGEAVLLTAVAFCGPPTASQAGERDRGPLAGVLVAMLVIMVVAYLAHVWRIRVKRPENDRVLYAVRTLAQNVFACSRHFETTREAFVALRTHNEVGERHIMAYLKGNELEPDKHALYACCMEARHARRNFIKAWEELREGLATVGATTSLGDKMEKMTNEFERRNKLLNQALREEEIASGASDRQGKSSEEDIGKGHDFESFLKHIDDELEKCPWRRRLFNFLVNPVRRFFLPTHEAPLPYRVQAVWNAFRMWCNGHLRRTDAFEEFCHQQGIAARIVYQRPFPNEVRSEGVPSAAEPADDPHAIPIVPLGARPGHGTTKLAWLRYESLRRTPPTQQRFIDAQNAMHWLARSCVPLVVMLL
jgi:hypothetical protein